MTVEPLFSFIIPTFNRAALVCESIRSAIAWLDEKGDGEIVVVDDCSTDDTLERLRREFAAEIASGQVRLLPLPRNGGVIKAKNAGGRAARGSWLIFLDSDDLMVPAAVALMRRAFVEFAHAPAMFFRCVDLVTGVPIGMPQDAPREYTLRDHLHATAYHSPYGECLPVVRRDAFGRFPYDERLNGMEGVAYGRMIRAMGPIVIQPIVARSYRVEGDDRLSSAAGIRRRSRALARGHWFVLREFGGDLTFAEWLRETAKVVVYRFRAFKAGFTD